MIKRNILCETIQIGIFSKQRDNEKFLEILTHLYYEFYQMRNFIIVDT